RHGAQSSRRPPGVRHAHKLCSRCNCADAPGLPAASPQTRLTAVGSDTAKPGAPWLRAGCTPNSSQPEIAKWRKIIRDGILSAHGRLAAFLARFATSAAPRFSPEKPPRVRAKYRVCGATGA